MLTEDRHHQILRELALRGSLNAAEFARRLGISGMTVTTDAPHGCAEPSEREPTRKDVAEAITIPDFFLTTRRK